MSKKDYEAIAEAIRVANLPLRNLDDFTVRRIVEAIASALAADNPAFNSKHFFDAGLVRRPRRGRLLVAPGWSGALQPRAPFHLDAPGPRRADPGIGGSDESDD